MTHQDRYCNRCGYCCHVRYPDGLVIRCRYLKDTKDGKTMCTIYSRRLGKIIHRREGYVPVICRNRDDVRYNFPGCTMNIFSLWKDIDKTPGIDKVL